MQPDWKRAWQPIVERVGTDFCPGEQLWGADPIEASAVRRFVEPLEFDCPLHTDQHVAEQYGYGRIIAPYSSLFVWITQPYWNKEMGAQFTSAHPDAQPEQSPVQGFVSDHEPVTTGYFYTDLDIEYIQPCYVGDHLYQEGNRLTSCVPKETSVGRGAFMRWASVIKNQSAERVANVSIGTYRYNPHLKGGSANE
ncbi:MaoC family dehydratase N-terminal domain-containing protein [Geomicrobium sp. JSM 1781026]|uniref:FAS1-like dehydratase domain-containing protein n=1 Tax=Geomicrobium sp. JSM 1781026 TaxID=3344580 RepID=UPI0035C093DB